MKKKKIKKKEIDHVEMNAEAEDWEQIAQQEMLSQYTEQDAIYDHYDEELKKLRK